NEDKPFIKNENKNKKINIEFVSANPTGPLHLASAVGACLGDSLANILMELGYEVHKEYYVNDCGRQVELLGKSLLARYTNKEIPEDGYHGDYLIELSKQLPDEAKEWEKNNQLDKFIKFAISKIIEQQKNDLKNLGVEFDRWFFESEIHQKKLQQKILDIFKEKNCLEEKDGAVWLKTQDETDQERVLKKSDGSNTYFLNDLAYHFTKYERGYTKIIDIWGADHHGYIPRMKAGLKLLGLDETKFIVILHQLVSIKKGSEILKMSKRAGKFYTLRQLIEETSKDAVRFFFTMRNPNTHVVFDIELAKKQSNENPLYYVQYAHARINSIIKNSIQKNIPQDKFDFNDYELNEDDKKIIRKIFWFEKILEQCEKELTPHHITIYLIELAKEFHSYYEKNRVIDELNKTQSASRLFILKGVKKILKKGLSLIGVTAPDEM
ncbi:MAG: arginine--tRNA ligase, partial [Elusimicrobiales bacterium]|nr:arginine--tRNA ligase [Elusimicrobiales bacterium]